MKFKFKIRYCKLDEGLYITEDKIITVIGINNIDDKIVADCRTFYNDATDAQIAFTIPLELLTNKLVCEIINES